jgi:transposase
MARRQIRDRDALAEQHVRLHAAGLSHREIAKVTGVHHRTVQRDLASYRADSAQPWPKPRRLAWLVAHPSDESYPWLAHSPAHSEVPDELSMRRKSADESAGRRRASQ